MVIFDDIIHVYCYQRIAYRLSNMLAEDEELKRTEGRNVKREFAGKLCEMVIVCYLFMFVYFCTYGLLFRMVI